MKPGIKFGISAVQSGQKASANNEPKLYANSSNGQFKVTGLVTKALGVKVGDNIMFLNNIDAVERAIQDKNPEVVAYAEENGFDLNDRASVLDLVKVFTQWYIAAGVILRKRNGEAQEAAIRVTKEDKEKWIAAHGAEYFAEMSDEDKQAFVEAKGGECDIDDIDGLVALLTAEDIESPKTEAKSGSKTASTSSATGVGVMVNFTDSNIWNTLKADLGDDKGKFVRVFDVDIENPEKAIFNDGFQDVEVLAYPINFAEDKEPIRRGGNEDENED